MFRYLTLLAAFLFLVMLIGGRQDETLRFGLAGAYDPPPPIPVVPVARAAAEPEAPVVLASAEADATPGAAPEPVAAAPAPEPAAQVMWVASNAINLREGPSTETAVIGRLNRSEAVTVVAEGPDGWLRVRLEGDGGEGYVAARLLTATDPGT